MKLTGQAKEDFEKWLDSIKEVVIKNTSTLCATFPYNFYQLSPSMKYGVYVDWLDSVGVKVVIKSHWMDIDTELFYFLIRWDKGFSNHHSESSNPTRNEARTAAIEKANEIYNNIHK